jgi:tungstate transport system ATP-binding protein
MSDAPLYRLEAVTKSHAGRDVLRVERLEMRMGEVTCLIGPTGAGKSTLLRILAGVEAPTAGSLEYLGRCLTGQELPLDLRRRITLVFQRPLLLAGTVRDNVEFGLRLRGLERRHRQAEAMLERLGLNGLASRAARTLSGGETQLVALARALVVEPEVLLLDEPTANLDPARVALVESVVAEVHRERGTTVIMATHNLFQAHRVAGRVVLLLDGRLIEDAPTERFFSAPSDPRAGAFVRGEMIY